LNNPRQCSFDFDKLACPAGSSSDSCLSPGELKSVHTFYEGLHTSDGALVFSGQAIGNPIPALASRPEGPGENLTDSIKILGFQNANYDWRQFDLDRDLPIIDARTGFVDAVDPDLRAFKAHGGKLLLYAGWRDTGITPENTVYYYESVREEMRGDPGSPGQDDWMRLFMVPGMGHCRGGPGVDTFDTLGAIEQWRERDVAPAEMPATSRESGLSRPLCPYPKYAKYDGSGELKDAANWSCSAE
jgi:feruloyl esterase